MPSKRSLEKMNKYFKGTLIAIGGNEDKGGESSENYTLDYINEGILSHVVVESGGKDALIVVIPTASSIPDEVWNNYKNAFAELGCTRVELLNIRELKDAESSRAISLLSRADCIMFSGGDQSKISNVFGGSTAEEILRKRVQEEAIVIAGTSAGAMMMSKEMIAGGHTSEALFKGGVKMYKGLQFMPSLIIDSHFIMRGRFGRLAEAVAQFPQLIGVGLAEDTGIVIKNRNQFKVIGSGMVVLFDASELTHNNFDILEEGTPMSMSNLKVHILANGDRFSIDERKLEVLPLESAFE
jgi:cyanophycinase